MKWFLPSYWWSLLMGGPSTSEELPPSETSPAAPISPVRSSEAPMSDGPPPVSTTKTKSTPGANQGSSKKKQSSGTKNVKRKRGRPPKKTS